MDVTNQLVNEGVEIFGLCDKQLACTTCSVHVLSHYDKIKPPSEVELDILYSLQDFQYEYTTYLDFSLSVHSQTRMSCQIHLTKEMEGILYSG